MQAHAHAVGYSEEGDADYQKLIHILNAKLSLVILDIFLKSLGAQ
jgi:hypothetical protein